MLESPHDKVKQNRTEFQGGEKKIVILKSQAWFCLPSMKSKHSMKSAPLLPKVI